MPLHKIAAQGPKAFHLISALNPFRGDLQAETMRQSDNRLDDRVSPVGIGDPLDKGTINLQRAHRKLMKMAEAGVAAAKVRHREMDTERRQGEHLTRNLRP